MRGDYVGARDLHVEAVRLSRLTGDGVVVASPLVWLGSAELRCGEYERARAALEEALAIGRAIGQPDAIATSLQRLGETALHQGHIDEAEPLYLEMLPLSRDLGADDDVAIGLEVSRQFPSAAATWCAPRYWQARKTRFASMSRRRVTNFVLRRPSGSIYSRSGMRAPIRRSRQPGLRERR